MKILMLNYEFPPLGGGGGKQAMYLAKEYAKKNDVYFLTVGFDKFGVEEKDGYKLHRIKTSRKLTYKCSISEMLSYINQARKVLPKIVNEFKPEIVHIFFTLPSGLLVFHPSLRKIPYVVSVRGSDVPERSPDRFKLMYTLMLPFANRIWNKAKKVVCNSEDLKEEVLSLNSKLEIEVIPNGIDTKKFAPNPLEKRSWKGEKTILYVGRLIPLKQIDLLIKHLPKLDNVKLRIVGSGVERDNLKKLAEDLNIKNRVEFIGEVSYDNIQREYQKADVYVQLSKVEGMSNTILEAMSCGLPVITTNVGGVNSFVNGNGFIIDRAEEWSDYFSRLNLNKMDKKSRKIAETMGFETMGKKYEGILK